MKQLKITHQNKQIKQKKESRIPFFFQSWLEQSHELDLVISSRKSHNLVMIWIL